MPQMVRNLSIGSKLVALLVVPAAGTALLATVGLAGGVGDRARADRERRVVAVVGQAATVVHELQEERGRAAAWVAGDGRRGGAELRARRQRVDRALAAYQAGAASLGRTGDPALDQAIAAAAARLGRLAVVRVEAERRLVTAERSVADHDVMVAALLGVERGLAARLDGPGPARVVRLLLAVAGAKEATGQEHALLAAAPTDERRDGGAPGTRAAGSAPGSLQARLTAAAAVARHELNGVRAAAGDRLDIVDRALATPGPRSARRLEQDLLGAGGGAEVGELPLWQVALAARAGALRRVERKLADDLTAAATASVVRQETRLRTQLMLLAVAAVAIAAAAVLLPRTRDGRPAGPGVAGGAVLGLARRGQTLLDRQLQLIDELEREEPDPDRLQGFFRLDHLATRLRRNAETLLAIAGPEPARRWDRPVPVAGLLRAAIAEVDDYLRVDLLAVDEVEVAGPVGVDLVHLVAELLDNAVAFSPPTAAVAVTGGGDGDGYLIEVADRGLGMTDEELAWANRRLAGRLDSPSPADGRLGLTVVGRLADRHGLGVQLVRSPAGGLTAAVRLPGPLLEVPTSTPAGRA